MSSYLKIFQVLCIVIAPLSLNAMMSEDPLFTLNDDPRPANRERSQSELNLPSPEKSPFSRKASAPASNNKKYIAIIEDNPVNQAVLRRIIQLYFEAIAEINNWNSQIEIISATNAEDGITLWNRYNPEVIFLDSHLGSGKTGLDILKERLEYCSGFVLNDLEKKTLSIPMAVLEARQQQCLMNYREVSMRKTGKKNHRNSEVNHAYNMLKASEDDIAELKNLQRRKLSKAKRNKLGITLGHVVCISTSEEDNKILIEYGANESCSKPFRREEITNILRKMF